MADVVEKALYDTDEYAWIAQQVAALEAGDFNQLDGTNLAVFLTDMAKRDRRDLQSRLTLLASHIIKFHAQPDQISTSWQVTVLTQQSEIEEITNDSQTLKNEVTAMLPKVQRNAVKYASIETGMSITELQAVLSVQPALTLAYMLSFDVAPVVNRTRP